MKILKVLFNFYINSSIHVALATVAFLKITQIYFDLTDNYNLIFFTFFSTITGYNFVKYAGVAKLHHRSLTDSLKIIQIFSFISFLAMCYFGLLLELTTLFYAAAFGILTILYAVPVLSGFEKSLREISYLKIVVVAFVWVGFTVIIPLVDAEKSIEYKEFLYAVQRFLILVVLILPFDIRDVKYDAISLQTVPQKIGIEQSKRLGVILLVISLILEYILDTPSSLKTPFMLFFFVTIIFLMRSKINQPKYYSSFFVEALPIIWWLLILGFHKI